MSLNHFSAVIVMCYILKMRLFSQMDTIFFNCLNSFIKLPSPCSIPFYLKDLFTTETSKIKHFQQQINVYNNAMIFIFCMFNQDEHLNHSADGIQLFVIYEKLYHLQRLLQHLFMYVPSFVQVYLYNPQAATEYQFVNTDESLCEHILLQLAETLHKSTADIMENQFREVYITAKVWKKHFFKHAVTKNWNFKNN